MLINANKQREVANAVKNAANEVKYLETVKLCDAAIPMVRKRFEEGIAESAMKGRTSFRCMLGVVGGQYESRGILANVLDELSFADGIMSMWFDWSHATRHEETGRCGCYIWDRWDAMCLDLIDDLKANGYEIEVEHNKHYLSVAYRDEDLSLTSEVLANHFIVIKW